MRSGYGWELVPLSPVDYVPRQDTVHANSNSNSNKQKKKKRPVTLTLPATVGREFVLRGTLSACGACNPVGKKRRRSGGAYCQRCETILKCGGRFLSKEMARFDIICGDGDGGGDYDNTLDQPSSRMIRVSASRLNAEKILVNKMPAFELPSNTSDDKDDVVENQDRETTIRDGDIVSFLVNPRGAKHGDGEPSSIAGDTALIMSLRFEVRYTQPVKSTSKRGDGSRNSTSRPSSPSDAAKNEKKRRDNTADVEDNQIVAPLERKDSVDLETRTPAKASCKDGAVAKNLEGGTQHKGKDHNDDKEEGEEESPMLSMHHFSASQWQNQSADIAFTDTPIHMHESENQSSGSPAMVRRCLIAGAMSSLTRPKYPSHSRSTFGCSKFDGDSPCDKKQAGSLVNSTLRSDGDCYCGKKRENHAGALVSSLSLDKLKGLRDECSCGEYNNLYGMMATDEKGGISSSAFRHALLSLAIIQKEQHQEESVLSNRNEVASSILESRDNADGASEGNELDIPHLLHSTVVRES